MNKACLDLLSVVEFNAIVGGTLEYCLKADSYNITEYNARKGSISQVVKEENFLNSSIEAPKEFIDKAKEKFNELYSAVYSDDSTICKIANNELRVDHSQHLAIYDAVIELHDNIKNLILNKYGYLASNRLLDEQFVKLIIEDERYYRILAFSCLYSDFESLYGEYVKARQEAKGAITPQSSFIEKELNKVVNYIFLVRNHQNIKDIEYWDIVDNIFKTIDYTAGKRNLPQGKTIMSCISEVKKMINDYFNKTKDFYTSLLSKANEELGAYVEKNVLKNSSAKPEEKKVDLSEKN